MLVLRAVPAARRGFSLIDVCVATALLAVAMGTLVGSVFWAMRLDETTEETAAASQELRAILEQLNGMPIAEVYAAYNADDGDDPDPERDYLGELRVEDPLRIIGKKAPPAVTVEFPEDVLDQLASERLPVTIRIDWEGVSGARSVQTTTLLRNP
jgi:hypothetical protein